MKKLISKINWLVISFSLFLIPKMVYADDEFPFEKLKNNLRIRPEVIDEFSWAFTLFMIVMTIFYFIIFIVILWAVGKRILSFFRGKDKEVFDKSFAIQVGIALAMLILLLSGLWLDILELIYDGISNIGDKEIKPAANG
ncbi:hypothetical protein P9265_14910 [Schinkia azotoformans]|uniref:hypothetical protein n=1 Tax=Schinkia azotoformans TaxID=1454 RepID=UPI002E1C4E74|nr:hypothetical protein [Schinkia azotoformans]